MSEWEKFVSWLSDSWGYFALIVAAGLVLLSAIKIYKTFADPVKAKKKKRADKDAEVDGRLDKLEDHDKKDMQRFDALDKKLDRVEQDFNTRMEKQEKTNQVMLESLLSIVQHMIDGNGIDGLKDARDNLISAVIKRDKPVP